MNAPIPNARRERLDEATSRRLAKLRAAPVDTSELLKAVEARIPGPPGQTRKLRPRLFTPMRAAAAILLAFGLILALVNRSSSGPVLASADRLAHIHEEVLAAGGGHATHVDSVSEANATLAAQCPGAPTLPAVPNAQVVACCTHLLGRKKIVCVTLRTDGVPVTMAVAHATDVTLPPSEIRTVGGITYHVQSHDDINMVMTERDGRWVCLIARLPTERLSELASSLRF